MIVCDLLRLGDNPDIRTDVEAMLNAGWTPWEKPFFRGGQLTQIMIKNGDNLQKEEITITTYADHYAVEKDAFLLLHKIREWAGTGQPIVSGYTKGGLAKVDILNSMNLLMPAGYKQFLANKLLSEKKVILVKGKKHKNGYWPREQQ